MENFLAAATAGIAAMFGGFGGGDNRMPPPERNAVRNEIKMQASTTARGSFDVACIAAAVAAREAALGTAAGANAQKTAWTQFKTAIKACGPAASSVADTANAEADEKAGAGSD